MLPSIFRFRVDHFSRYGYEEEDSEDVVTMPHAVVTPLTSQERQRPMGLRPDDQSLPPTCRISEAESLDSSSAVKRPYSLMRTAGTNLADRESYQKTKPCFGKDQEFRQARFIFHLQRSTVSQKWSSWFMP